MMRNHGRAKQGATDSMNDPKQDSAAGLDGLHAHPAGLTKSGAPGPTRRMASGESFASFRERFASVERAKREWEMTVDALPELICVVDNSGRLVRANLTVERWSLGSVVSVAGQPFHRFIHHDCDPSCYLTEFLAQAMEHTLAGESIELEIYDVILRRYVHVRALPIHGSDEPTGRNMAIIIHDITSRKEMESTLQQNNDRLKVLNAVSSAILAAQSPEETAQIALQHIVTLVPFQQACILLNDPVQRQFLLLAEAAKWDKEKSTVSRLGFTQFGDKVTRCTDELFLVADLGQVDNITNFEKRLHAQGVGAYINVPLRGDNLLMGMFVVGMESIDDFNASQIQVIREVSEMLTVAIRQVQLVQKYRDMADQLQSLQRLRDESTDKEGHLHRSPLALIQAHPELMNDVFFNSLVDESADMPRIHDNWDDLLR